MAPVRIQRKRTKGWRMPENTASVGRGGYFGNPFKGANAANAYRRWMENKMGRVEFYRRRAPDSMSLFSDKHNVRREMTALRGKNLACWCPLDQPCHADVLLELANRPIGEVADRQRALASVAHDSTAQRAAAAGGVAPPKPE